MGGEKELVFVVARDRFGQLVARSEDPELVVFGADREELVDAIHEAVRRHYETPADAPEVIRLHHVEHPGSHEHDH